MHLAGIKCLNLRLSRGSVETSSKCDGKSHRPNIYVHGFIGNLPVTEFRKSV